MSPNHQFIVERRVLRNCEITKSESSITDGHVKGLIFSSRTEVKSVPTYLDSFAIKTKVDLA
jgi:hypothetical protein